MNSASKFNWQTSIEEGKWGVQTLARTVLKMKRRAGTLTKCSYTKEKDGFKFHCVSPLG